MMVQRGLFTKIPLFTLIVVAAMLAARDEAIASPGFTTRVSVASDGTQSVCAAQGPCSRSSAVSADGRYVAFQSDASNLVATESNDVTHVFVRDLETGATERASISTGAGEANMGSSDPTISDDGRYIAFRSFATNLVASDTNGFPDVF